MVNSSPPMTWMQHLADFRAKNPHLKGAAVMKGASATYKKPIDAHCGEQHLTKFLKDDLLGETIIEKYSIPNTKLQLEAQQIKDEIDRIKSGCEDLDSIKGILCNHMDYGFFSSRKGVGYLLSIIEHDDYTLLRKLLDAYHNDGGKKYSNLSIIFPVSNTNDGNEDNEDNED